MGHFLATQTLRFNPVVVDMLVFALEMQIFTHTHTQAQKCPQIHMSAWGHNTGQHVVLLIYKP